MVLYAALVILIQATQNVPVRAMATLILTPIPSVMVMVGPPYSMALPLLLLGLVGMVAWKNCGRDSIFQLNDEPEANVWDPFLCVGFCACVARPPSPRCGNVGIAVAISKDCGKGGKAGFAFPGFPQSVISTACRLTPSSPPAGSW